MFLRMLVMSMIMTAASNLHAEERGLPATAAAKVIWVYPFDQRTSDAFPGLTGALSSAVASLKDEQHFNLIPFGFATSLKPLTEDRLVEAIAENRAWADRFLKRAIPRAGDAEPAIRRAFVLEPTEIWLLAGDDLGEQVLKRVRELNHRRRVKVHAVALVEKMDAPEFVFETHLKQIAEENGGTFQRLAPVKR